MTSLLSFAKDNLSLCVLFNVFGLSFLHMVY